MVQRHRAGRNASHPIPSRALSDLPKPAGLCSIAPQAEHPQTPSPPHHTHSRMRPQSTLATQILPALLLLLSLLVLLPPPSHLLQLLQLLLLLLLALTPCRCRCARPCGLSLRRALSHAAPHRCAQSAPPACARAPAGCTAPPCGHAPRRRERAPPPAACSSVGHHKPAGRQAGICGCACARS